MDTQLFGMREMYDVVLKATLPLEIGKRQIEPNEPIVIFDRILLSTTKENKSHVAATGGYDNREWVFWDNTTDVEFNFSQGVFSKTQFAIVSNSKMIDIEAGEKIAVPRIEEKESDDNGLVILMYPPIPESMFLYRKDTGAKIVDYTFEDEYTIKVQPYTDVIATYSFEYGDGARIVTIGQQQIPGFISLEGKTRLKDDTSGLNITGILRIPKLKLMSDLSMRLGRNASAQVMNFVACGLPVGNRANKQVAQFTFLESDIDDDLDGQ